MLIEQILKDTFTSIAGTPFQSDGVKDELFSTIIPKGLIVGIDAWHGIHKITTPTTKNFVQSRCSEHTKMLMGAVHINMKKNEINIFIAALTQEIPKKAVNNTCEKDTMCDVVIAGPNQTDCFESKNTWYQQENQKNGNVQRLVVLKSAVSNQVSELILDDSSLRLFTKEKDFDFHVLFEADEMEELRKLITFYNESKKEIDRYLEHIKQEELNRLHN